MKDKVDYQENNLVNACLLQYPFGRGGLHENRKRPDGTMHRNVSIEEYVKHLSMLSQPQFHHDFTHTVQHVNEARDS